jgi:hypothetical protein
LVKTPEGSAVGAAVEVRQHKKMEARIETAAQARRDFRIRLNSPEKLT